MQRYSSFERDLLETGRLGKWNFIESRGLVQFCVGSLCQSAGKWTSFAFTLSLWLWEPAWEEKTGIGNVKMLILCWKDREKEACMLNAFWSPGCSICGQPSTALNKKWACLPNTHALLFAFQAELKSLFINCRLYSARLHTSTIHLFNQWTDLGVPEDFWRATQNTQTTAAKSQLLENNRQMDRGET